MTPDQKVAKAVSGDFCQLEELLHEIGPRLRSQIFIGPRWNRSVDVDDVLQVTFLEAFLRIRSLASPTVAGFTKWLSRIARHNLVDAVRALKRLKRPNDAKRVTRGPNDESARSLLMAIATSDTSASSLALLKEQKELLRSAIARLPMSYRIVIELVDLGERPVQDVALEMNRSTAAIHMLRARALDRLRELMHLGFFEKNA